MHAGRLIANIVPTRVPANEETPTDATVRLATLAALHGIAIDVAWYNLAWEGRILLADFPWARVGLGRVASRVQKALASDELLTWIFESLDAVFPEKTGWLGIGGLNAIPLVPDEQKFISWAFKNAEQAKLVIGPIAIVGAWRSWPMAILLIRTMADDSVVYQFRRRGIAGNAFKAPEAAKD